MNKDIFLNLLTKAELTKKDFANASKVSYGTVSNWSEERPVPDWVESWLQNYIDKKKFDNIKEIIKDEL